jgi:hypothetical protein
MLCTAHSNQTEKSVIGAECSTHGGGERRDVYKVVVGKPDGKRPLGRPWRRPRWESNIKMDLTEMGWEWTGLIWLRIGTGGGHL